MHLGGGCYATITISQDIALQQVAVDADYLEQKAAADSSAAYSCTTGVGGGGFRVCRVKRRRNMGGCGSTKVVFDGLRLGAFSWRGGGPLAPALKSATGQDDDDQGVQDSQLLGECLITIIVHFI